MTKPTRAGRVAVAAVALGLGLAGCGSDTTSGDATAAEDTTTTTTETTTSQAPPTSAEAAAPAYTIVEYIRDNNLTETPVHRGDPGTPVVELPVPPGWADMGEQAPPWAYSAIAFTEPSTPADPPTIIALMSKLTGDVDPAKVLEFAPNELKNLPGYMNLNEYSESTLNGYEAAQAGGTYVRDGATRLIAQKTVVIPAPDGVFVLQLNADGSEADMGPLMDATAAIDNETTITP